MHEAKPVTVVAIEPFGPGHRARRVVLSDTCERVTATAVVRAVPIEVGDPFDASALDRALTPFEQEHARQVALRLLGHRERSRAELLRGLTDRGFPQPVAHDVVEDLARVGLVDDSRFAQLWVRTRIATGHGSRRVRQELQRRGIDDDTAAAALEDLQGDSAELARAKALVKPGPLQDRRSRERQVRRLVSRGFGLDIALRAVDATIGLSCDDARQGLGVDSPVHLD